MSGQTLLLAIYGGILILVALIGAIVTPFVNYLLAQRLTEKQTTVLAQGQRQIQGTVDATHELVNGQSELLRAQREAKGYAAGAADARNAEQLADELGEQEHKTNERNGKTGEA